MGIFIQISADESGLTSDVKNKLVRVCPVDIFEMESDHLIINPANEDECTLCKLCLEAAPAGALTILKTYTGEKMISYGTQER